MSVSAVGSLVFARGAVRNEERSANIALGGKHRTAITGWALVAPRHQSGYDETVKSFNGDFERLCRYLAQQGYQCLELSIVDLKRGGFYPMDMRDEDVARMAREVLSKTGMEIIGTLLHIADGTPLGPTALTGLDLTRHDFYELLGTTLAKEKLLGSKYVTFQIDLPSDKKGTGGAYRDDDEYLWLSAQRVHRMQQVSFKLGLNFYVEAHIDRISEDPQAFCKIFDYCPSYFEVNLDVSHYLYRNITRGVHVERIFERVGHSHQRMARKHGDLSSDVGIHFDGDTGVGDCAADWEAKGVTWQALEAMRPILERGGLSSRVIVGETGPALTVRDALALDAKLVPLWRAMAQIADGHPLPQGKNPFGL